MATLASLVNQTVAAKTGSTPINTSAQNAYLNTPNTLGVKTAAPQQNVPVAAPKVSTPAPTLPQLSQAQTSSLDALNSKSVLSDVDKKNLNYGISQGYKPSATLQSLLNGNTNSTSINGGSIVTTPSVVKPTDITNPTQVKNVVDTAGSATSNPVTTAATTGLLGLSGTNQADTGPTQDAIAAINKQISDLDSQYAQVKANYAGDPNLSLNASYGEQQITDQKYSAQRQALTDQLNAALQANAQHITGAQTQQSGYSAAAGAQNAAQSTQLGGYESAAGLTQPVQVPYSNQYLNPQTGAPVGGGTAGTLPADAQNVVNTYAAQVKAGTMTRADAESRLQAYGVAGINALTQALGSDFNTNASNASAQTTATGQQIQTAADSANKALDTLTTAFNSLPGIQTGGIPATNNIANWIASAFGSSALQTYKTNLEDARSQLVGVLNSSGGTPTGNEATANAYLPDDMTVGQFNTNVGTTANPGIVRQLIAQKVSSYTNSGNQNQSNSQTPTGTTSSGVGYTIQ